MNPNSKVAIFLLFIVQLAGAQTADMKTTAAWIGNSDSLPRDSALAAKGIQFDSIPKSGRINLRAGSYGSMIEVYNFRSKNWVSTSLTFDRSFAVTNDNLEQARSSSECQTADLIFEVNKSNVGISIYADGYLRGETDKFGKFKKRVMTLCKGASCQIELKKKKCEQETLNVLVSVNPQTEVYSKKLKCKR